MREDITNPEVLASMCATTDQNEVLITPTEETRKVEIKHWLDPMGSYIVLEKKPEKSYRIFTDLVAHGIPGLIISRIYPEKLKRKYKLAKTPILWLSRIEVKNAISPDDLLKLRYIVEDFARKNEDSVILLDGLEYLITQNTFETAVKHLQELKDIIVLNNSRLIITLHRETLEPKELSTLEREFTVVE